MSEAVPQPTVVPSFAGATEVLLIRHGRSADIVPGSPESGDPPLHDVGREQAAALATRLTDKRIDAIYASTLSRAIQTAEAIAGPRSMPVTQLHDLREVDLGEWEHGEFRRRAAAGDPEWMAFAESGRWESIPGAESDADFRRRVSDVIGQVIDTHSGETVAVVCHGGVINGYLAELFGLHATFFCAIENTSVTVVRINRHGRVVVAVNDCHHLYDPVVGGPPLS